MKRKLIEVALPLEAINKESAREKSIRHGHPSTLHLWWSRKPLATARAVLFAQLVDDPSSRPEEFPTEDAQRAERERLHRLIERLVVWENVRDEKLLAQAHAEILRSTDGSPPVLVDPFAGGGSIPLEAQRLGLEAHASDLNPVAVLINKALIEIPPKFRDQSPVFPGLAESQYRTWRGAEGLAADVRAYGEWMRDEAEERIGHLYPKATLPDGTKATVIAWIWARTVTCPNPACRIEMPLVSKWWLGKKKGKEAYVVPVVQADLKHASGKKVVYTIAHDARGPVLDGTVGRKGAYCVACQSAVTLAYIRDEGRAGRLGAQLIATAAEGHRRRIYLRPTQEHVATADVETPEDVPTGDLPMNPRDFKTPNYGLTTWSSLFTKRQLVALAAFSDLVATVRQQVLSDALARGIPEEKRLDAGGIGASAYADAVATYLGATVSKLADRNAAIVSWDSSTKQEAPSHVFTRQAVAMNWEYAEANIFGSSTGNWLDAVQRLSTSIERLPASRAGRACQADAARLPYSNVLLSTDPPYYDNIGYSDLSDFFYVWLRRSLRELHPSLFGTMFVPKAEELVANPYRQGGPDGAKKFFEDGFREVFALARETALPDYPVTVYYAFRQSDNTDDGTSSSGWETLLDGMIRSGWSITATWPVRSELGNRILSQGTNALASSIVLALRPRPRGAATTDRRGLIAALQAELPQALRDLQQGAIAPVDLPQAAIGPGMAVFTRYAKVLEPDGSPMSVRSALARINEILDQVLSEQEGDFDAPTRFAIAWYRQHGYGTGNFGDADNLARARNTSVDTMDRSGILVSRAGKVTLVKPADTPADYDVVEDEHSSTWEILHHTIRVFESDGIQAAGTFLKQAGSRPDQAGDPDLLKELAFLLFSVAEKNGWTKDAISFNAVAQSWGEVTDAAKSATASTVQGAFNLDEDY